MTDGGSIQAVQQLRQLERELSLKQMQIQRLLNITQAINNNMSADDLFNMYREFLRFEMGMSKVLLLIKEVDHWTLAVQSNLDQIYTPEQLIPILKKILNLYTVKQTDDPTLHEFDIVIPVYHKEQPISYALVTVANKEDLYHKIQFIQTITNIIAVAIENKRLFRNQMEQERMNKEIELAREVQSLLIPQSLPKYPHFELSSIYKPHYNVGGDYFDYLPIGEDRYLICLADISGKGVSAALLMSNLQANLRQLARQYSDIEKLVVLLNEAVYALTGGDRFLTLFIAEVNPKAGHIHYINCGHISPILYHDNQVEYLSKGCTVLGAFDQLPFIEHGRIPIGTPSLLLVFTDGLTDLVNSSNQFFEIENLERFVCKFHNESAAEFNRQLMNELENFKGSQTFPDDITVLTCKIDPNAVS
ncbi:MAG: PP2C family protein-serine/threonine phosphatase [Saprospiraceae bacterium]|nr:PP2C family protein-serine/threonine phosphatase [Saprospiraceae bacterium]